MEILSLVLKASEPCYNIDPDRTWAIEQENKVP